MKRSSRDSASMFSVEVSDDDSEGPYVAAVIYRLSGTKFGGGIYFCPGRSRIWLPETCMGRCGWRLGSGIGLVLLRVRSRMWRHSLVAPSRCLSRRFHHLLPHRFLHMRSRTPLLIYFRRFSSLYCLISSSISSIDMSAIPFARAEALILSAASHAL